MNNEKLSTIGAVLVMVFLAAMLVSTIARWFPIPGDTYNSIRPIHFGIFATYTMGVIAVAVRVGISIWLYRKSEKRLRWLWVLLALVFGILALIAYYLIEIYCRLTAIEKTLAANNQMPCADKPRGSSPANDL